MEIFIINSYLSPNLATICQQRLPLLVTIVDSSGHFSYNTNFAQYSYKVITVVQYIANTTSIIELRARCVCFCSV